jgi:hypothetical protein
MPNRFNASSSRLAPFQMLCPSASTAPDDGGNRPDRIRSSVVLPHPERPTREMNSPRLIDRLMSFSASTWPLRVW